MVDCHFYASWKLDLVNVSHNHELWIDISYHGSSRNLLTSFLAARQLSYFVLIKQNRFFHGIKFSRSLILTVFCFVQSNMLTSVANLSFSTPCLCRRLPPYSFGSLMRMFFDTFAFYGVRSKFWQS